MTTRLERLSEGHALSAAVDPACIGIVNGFNGSIYEWFRPREFRSLSVFSDNLLPHDLNRAA